MNTISGVVPFLVAHVARSLAADPEPLLRGSGVDAASPPRGDEHIAIERYFDVWRRAMALFDDAFPLRVASFFRHEDNEIFGFLAMSCATIGEAFDRTLQYSRLYTVGARYEMDVDHEATRITWLPWPGELDHIGYRAAMDYHMANMEQAIRQLGNLPPRPIEVRLRHSEPRDAAAYLAFYGSEPRFGCPRYELVYPVGLRDVGVTTFNSRLRDYFDLECRRMIEKLGAATGIATQVRKALIGVRSRREVLFVMGASSRVGEECALVAHASSLSAGANSPPTAGLPPPGKPKAIHRWRQYVRIDRPSFSAQLRGMRRPTKTEQIQIRVTRAEKRDLVLRARAAGLDLSSWILGRLSPPHAVRFRELVRSLAAAPDPSYAFAEIGDLLSELRRDQLSAAVEVLPPVQLGAVPANQLAAMVELRATRLGVRPPIWTEQIQPLSQPWFPTALVSVRLDLLCNSPPAYRRRNLFVTSTLEHRV